MVNVNLISNNLRVGAIAVLAANVFFYFVLAWLTRAASNPFDRILLLAMGNLFSACLLLVPRARNGVLFLNRATTAAIIGWSIAYSITYGAFVRWPAFFPVWGLIAAQAGAPLFAVLFSGDHRRETASFGRRMLLSFPILFLLAIAALEWKASRHASKAPYLAVALILLFTCSQSCARVVARNAPNAYWAPPRLALFNALLLLGFWAADGASGLHSDRLAFVRNAAALALGTLLIQALYLFALAKTPPFLSAILLSTSVPVSIFGDNLAKTGRIHSYLSLWLSIMFVLATAFVAWGTSRLKRHDTEALAQMEAD